MTKSTRLANPHFPPKALYSDKNPNTWEILHLKLAMKEAQAT